MIQYCSSAIRLLLIVLTCFTQFSCQNNSRQAEHTDSLNISADTIIAYNRQIVQSENQEIYDYSQRYRWNVTTTATGLRYMILKPGRGSQPGKGDVVAIRYSASLLNGDLLEQSDPQKPYRFRLGTGNVTNGLEEGILLMNKGAHAKLIVPSHLAFGLLGDQNKLHSRAVLVYDVELSEIFRTNP